MYGGYIVTQGRIPIRTGAQPSFVGKRTTAADLATLMRSLNLAAVGQGGLSRHGFRPSQARFLLYLLAHSQVSRIDRFLLGPDRGAPEGRLDQHRPARHGPRLLAGRKLRRQCPDLERPRCRRRLRCARRPHRARVRTVRTWLTTTRSSIASASTASRTPGDQRAAEPRSPDLLRPGQALVRDGPERPPRGRAVRFVGGGRGRRPADARRGRPRALLPPAVRRPPRLARPAPRPGAPLGRARRDPRGRLRRVAPPKLVEEGAGPRCRSPAGRGLLLHGRGRNVVPPKDTPGHADREQGETEATANPQL